MATVARTTIRVGTRGSPLAMRQTQLVVDAIAAFNPNLELDLVQIATRGDDDRTSELPMMGVGVFVKALEEALAEERVDFVVHSLKDVPSELPEGFEIATATKRADPRDILVNRWRASLADLPEGARLGTGSPRRRAQILAARPDITVAPIRGNVGTRLDKALAGADSEYDGAVLAAAGLERLGRIDSVAEFLDPGQFVPAVGQGALAIEIRARDGRMRVIAESAGDSDTHLATSAERAFLRAMGGGCAVPISAHAVVDSKTLAISGFAADPDGTRVVRRRLEGSADDPEALGRRLAGEILDAGGRDLVETTAGG